MKAPALARFWLIALIGVSVLSARVSGIHLHLCRDGQEPPATVHVSDAGIHDEHHDLADEQHSNVDVLLDDGLAKTAKSLFDLPSLAGPTAVSFVLIALQGTVWTLGDQSLSRAVRRFLRPPLRGPPTSPTV
ncbi:MAG: hypothetical protein ACREVZ_03910 [Burkholderiales bacterium]